MNITISPAPPAYPLLLSEFLCYIDIVDNGGNGIQFIFMSLDGSEPAQSYNSPVQVTAGTTVRVKVVDTVGNTTYARQDYPAVPGHNEPVLLLKDIADTVRPLMVADDGERMLPLTVQVHTRMSAIELFSFPAPSGWGGGFPYVSPLLNVCGKSKFLVGLSNPVNCTTSLTLRLLDANGREITQLPANVSCSIVYPDYGSGLSTRKSIMQEFDTYGAAYAGVVIHSTTGANLSCTVAGV